MAKKLGKLDNSLLESLKISNTASGSNLKNTSLNNPNFLSKASLQNPILQPVQKTLPSSTHQSKSPFSSSKGSTSDSTKSANCPEVLKDCKLPNLPQSDSDQISHGNEAGKIVLEHLPTYQFGGYNCKRFQPEDKVYFPNLDPYTRQSNWNDDVPIRYKKVQLIDAVSKSLLKVPNFKSKVDPERNLIFKLSAEVASHDPEFILRLALYTRNVLNVCSTANFLLAYSSFNEKCRIYLKKYYNRIVNGPADWIDVAEIYQYFDDDKLKFHSIPAALRRVMKDKFTDFDEYQLGKYKRKMKQSLKSTDEKPDKKTNERDNTDICAAEDDNISDDTNNTNDDTNDLEKKSFTLKQLIRLLHICEPVRHVMCLLGQKYPDTLEKFKSSKLPGIWNQELAGTRMKLVPQETWKMQISKRGNKVEVWEELIEHEKLPYKGMLCNLRNIIFANISESHHEKVLNQLENESAVICSKQYPVHLLSFCEKIEDLLNKDAFMKKYKTQKEDKKKLRKKKKRTKFGKKIKTPNYDAARVQKYVDAIKESATISTVRNMPPVKGVTYIIMSGIIYFHQTNELLKALPADLQKLYKARVLLAMICLAKCELGQLALNVYDMGYIDIKLESDNILENVNRIIEMIDEQTLPLRKSVHHQTKDLQGYLHDTFIPYLMYSSKVDNIILLTGGSEEACDKENSVMKVFLDNYRQHFNKDLLYFRVNVSGGSSMGRNTDELSSHLNDVYISGYSDQIVRLIAERVNGGQLTYIENIDKESNFKLDSMQNKESQIEIEEVVLSLPSYTPKWRMLQIYISSTFLDMQAERDLLMKFVFPQLRSWARFHLVNVYDVDLRWGVSEAESNSNELIEMCLKKSYKCQIFIGILGMTYGSVPDTKHLQEHPLFDWLNHYKEGSSATELEMHAGALRAPKDFVDNAFFFIRDPKFIQDVPLEYVDTFIERDCHKIERLEELKERVRSSGLTVYDGYPCQWGGVYNGQPIVKGLQSFGQRVLDNIWNAIEEMHPAKRTIQSELKHEMSNHNTHAKKLSEDFVGRINLLRKAESSLDLHNQQSGIIHVSGLPGSGKSALMAQLHKYVKDSSATAKSIIYFVGLTPGDGDVVRLLKHIIYAVAAHCKGIYKDYTDSYSSLLETLSEILTSFIKKQQIYVFLDGLNNLSHAYHGDTLNWLLPLKKILGLTFVCSTTINSDAFKVISDHARETIEVPLLDLSDGKFIVTTNLTKQRKVLDDSLLGDFLNSLPTRQDFNLPLYLNLVSQQLSHFESSCQISRTVNYLGNTVEELVKDMLMRMEANIGADLVKYSFSLIVLSKQDLHRQDLLDLLNTQLFLSDQKITFQDATSVKLPPGFGIQPHTFLRLIDLMKRLLNSHQLNSSDCLMFAHEPVKEAVKAHYVDRLTSDVVIQLHTLLAGHFMRIAGEALDFEKHFNSVTHSFATMSLPYHLMCSGCYKELAELLTNIKFIWSKLHFWHPSKLIVDFQANIEPMNVSIERKRIEFLSNKTVLQFQQFLIGNAYYLSRPTLLLQLALEQPEDTAIYQKAFEAVKDVSNMWNHLLMQNRTTSSSVKGLCKSTLGHFGLTNPTCVAVSTNDQDIIIGCANSQIHLYNRHTNSKIKTFIGHVDSITALEMIDQNCFCSASKEKTIIIWNIEQGHRLHTLNGHTHSVTDISVDSNGKTIASVGLDFKICYWSVSDGQLISELTSERNLLNCVQFFQNKQEILVGGWDHLVKSWDLTTMKLKFKLCGHNTAVQSVAIHKSEECAVSSSYTEVLVWSLQHRCPMQNLQSQSSCLLFSPSGDKLYVSDGMKPAVSVYNYQELNVFQEHKACSWNSKVVGVALNYRQMFVAHENGNVIQYRIAYNNGQANFHKEIIEKVSDFELTTLDLFAGKLFIGTMKGIVMCIIENFSENAPYRAKFECQDPLPVSNVQSDFSNTYVATQDGSISYFTHEGYNQTRDTCRTENVKAKVQAHNGELTCMKLYKHFLCTSGNDKVVNIYSLRNINRDGFEQLHCIKDLHPESVMAMDFNSRGLFSLSSDKFVKIIKYSSLMEKKNPEVETFCTTTVTSPSMLTVLDDHLVVGSTNGHVYIMKNCGTVLTDFKCLHTDSKSRFCVFINKCHVSLSYPYWNHWRDKSTENYRTKDVLPYLNIFTPFHNDVLFYATLPMKKLTSLDGHIAPITDMKTVPDETVVTVATDGIIKQWTLTSGINSAASAHDVHPESITAIAFGGSNLAASVSHQKDPDRNLQLKVWRYDFPSSHQFAVECIDTSILAGDLQAYGLFESAYIGFLDDHAQRFVTHGESGFFEYKRTYEAGTPIRIYSQGNITALACDFSAGCDFVVLGTGKGHVSAHEMIPNKWHKGHRQIFNHQVHNVEIVKIFTKRVNLIRHIYSIDAAGDIAEWTIPVGQKNWDDETCDCDWLIYTSSLSGLDYLPKKTTHSWFGITRTDSLPTSIYGNEAHLLIGNNDGQLDLHRRYNLSTLLSKRVHVGSVTSCAMISNYIFTASHDGSIKVWAYIRRNQSINQLVQFKCKAGVTCMDVVAAPEHTAIITAGDTAGNVYFLRWQPRDHKVNPMDTDY